MHQRTTQIVLALLALCTLAFILPDAEGFTLTVQSTPIKVAISGDAPGTTDYTASFSSARLVYLNAPMYGESGGDHYVFVRWHLDGLPRAESERGLSVGMDCDLTAVAEYVFGYRQTIQSQPIIHIPISGAFSYTNSTEVVRAGDAISLSAHSQYSSPESPYECYVFVRWSLDGVDQPENQCTLSFMSDQAHTAIVTYRLRACSVTVTSSPIAGVPITGTLPGTTNYTAVCDSGSTITLSAPPTVTVGNATWYFVGWAGFSPGLTTITPTIIQDRSLNVEYSDVPTSLRIASCPPGIPFDGTFSGITDSTVSPIPGQSVSLNVPATVTKAGKTYRFLNWILDTGKVVIAEPNAQITAYAQHTMNAIYQADVSLIIKGPVERGETILPEGVFALKVDIYLKDVSFFSGFQTKLCFLDETDLHAGWSISRTNGNPDWGGYAVEFNTALWPNLFVAPDSKAISFITMDPEISLYEETWLCSITYDVFCSGSYRILPDPTGHETTMILSNSEQLPFTTVPGHLVTSEPPTLHVLSMPVENVPITGSIECHTDHWVPNVGAVPLTLTAPASSTWLSFNPSAFIRWKLDGNLQPEGQQTISVPPGESHWAVAIYTPLTATLTVNSTTAANVPITGDAPGTTNYTVACEAGRTVSLTAPATVTVSGLHYRFLSWKHDYSPAINKRTLSVTTDGPHTATCAYGLVGDANGDCTVNILDLIAVRNRYRGYVFSVDDLRADVNGDGRINSADLIAVRERLGQRCP